LLVSAILFLVDVTSESKHRQFDVQTAKTVLDLYGFETTVEFLGRRIQSIQLPRGISQVLDDGQLDYICCAALNLEAAIMICLSVALKGIQTKTKGDIILDILVLFFSIDNRYFQKGYRRESPSRG